VKRILLAALLAAATDLPLLADGWPLLFGFPDSDGNDSSMGDVVYVPAGVAVTERATYPPNYPPDENAEALDAVDADDLVNSASQGLREAPIIDLTYPASGQCGAQYPVAANTRMIAGEGLALDVLKCRLKPLDFREYPVTFTAADRKRLRAAFPDGVCDYNPGVGQRARIGTWLSYGDERTGTTPPTKPR
jgi:hypothetical protein